MLRLIILSITISLMIELVASDYNQVSCFYTRKKWII